MLFHRSGHAPAGTRLKTANPPEDAGTRPLFAARPPLLSSSLFAVSAAVAGHHQVNVEMCLRDSVLQKVILKWTTGISVDTLAAEFESRHRVIEESPSKILDALSSG
ncbi:hypothetical protein Tco_1508494 [Tanacetum coccineum]